MQPDRLTLSAIADRLVFGDEHTFSFEDGVTLWRLLETAPRLGWFRNMLSFRAQGSMPTGATSGYSPGIGNVSFKDERKFDVDSRGRAVIRAGQWKLHKTRNAIEIEQVMADGTGENTARIIYWRGCPMKMQRQVQKGLAIGPAVLSFATFVDWKTPTPSDEAAAPA